MILEDLLLLGRAVFLRRFAGFAGQVAAVLRQLATSLSKISATILSSAASRSSERAFSSASMAAACWRTSSLQSETSPLRRPPVLRVVGRLEDCSQPVVIGLRDRIVAMVVALAQPTVSPNSDELTTLIVSAITSLRAAF
jgi:hypothetical protein